MSLPKNRYNFKKSYSWNEFTSWSSEILNTGDADTRRWVFRGHGKSSYDLKTTIEREAERSGIQLKELKEKCYERRLLNEFRRGAHHYLTHVPERYDLSEWLAMMQHYGAPTRLLDWSYSPFIACYFAMEKADDGSCIVWALESENYTTRHTLKELGPGTLRKHFREKIEPNLVQKPEITKYRQYALIHYLFDHPTAGLFVVNPFKLSERSTIQQAVHLMPGDITQSFEKNLLVHDKDHDNLIRLEIVVDPNVRREFLRNLHRMNINRASLFPGLQGFAESMATRLATPNHLSY
jgi:hypothetical protein